jgi:hypothetical protein
MPGIQLTTVAVTNELQLVFTYAAPHLKIDDWPIGIACKDVDRNVVVVIASVAASAAAFGRKSSGRAEE